MTRHRCTRCKEDVGEYGIRHKYASGLFCEACLREIGRRGGVARGIFSDLWSMVKGVVSTMLSPFRAKSFVKERSMAVAYSVQASRARVIPKDARNISPQKR